MQALRRRFGFSSLPSQETLMSDFEHQDPRERRLARRRVTLLASTALAFAVVLTGAGYRSFAPLTFASPAHAAETAPQPAGFADLVSKVKPAVVSVRVRMEQPASSSSEDNRQAVPPGMEKFFQQFGFGDNGRPMTPQQRRLVTGEGSGFFISPDGYAVTNYHVVDHAKSVQVTTDDGATYTAKVIGTDQKTDLALIKVDANKSFTYVKFGDTPPRVGDWVVAVGNPFGLGGTVTAGIVSARGRDIGAGPYDDYIQIDAPINKGNSGGPAFNSNGEVIGVNTAIYSPSGGSVGIGFDIPAETAKMVIAQLKDKGAVTRGWIGVQVQPVTQDIADSLGLKQAHGAIVDEPQANSPAARAGIQAGDVITAVNGKEVKDSRDLARKISETAPGTTVKLDVMRQGGEKTFDVTLAKLPDQQQAKASTGSETKRTAYLGVEVAPAGDVEGAGSKGVVVTGIDPNGPAAERGIKTGDVILSAGNKDVASANGLRDAIAAAKQGGKKDVLLRVKSADATRFVAIPIG
jgi:serine protease Do